jgi:abhydrolase domain-containing protein 6
MIQPPLSITLDGHRLTYTTAGHPDAPPVMMLHGWLSYRGVWRQTIAALQDRYYCVAVDLLGCGDSDKPDEADYSLPAQGQRVLQLADALGWNQFALIGHSMGGQIALCIASMLAPQRCTCVISVAGVVTARLTPFVENVNFKLIAMSRMFPQLFAMLRRLARYRRIVCSPLSGFRTWFYRLDAVPFEDWALDRDMAFQPQGARAAYRAGQAIHALDLTAQLGRITAPTLAIFGRQDGVVRLTDGPLVAQQVPNGRLVLIDECGHFPMYEKTEQYLEVVQTFLSASIQAGGCAHAEVKSETVNRLLLHQGH